MVRRARDRLTAGYVCPLWVKSGRHGYVAKSPFNANSRHCQQAASEVWIAPAEPRVAFQQVLELCSSLLKRIVPFH